MSRTTPLERAPRPRARGFTLIELMIVVAIVSILAAVAFPGYAAYMRKARRADAWSLIQGAQLAQEKWRASNTTYAAATTDLTGVCPTSGICLSGGGYYSLAISSPTATGFVLTATPAVASQIADTACSTITITQSATGIAYGPTAKCWNR